MTLANRPMTRADVETVATLFGELTLLHSERLPWLFRTLDRSSRDDSMFQALLAAERAAIFVADVGQVVGFVRVVLREAAVPVLVPQLRCVIENVYVAPSRRRGGVATGLLLQAEKWAAERGAAGIDLSVYEFSEPARGLFAAMGYATLSRRMSKNL